MFQASGSLRRALPILALALAACGEPASLEGSGGGSPSPPQGASCDAPTWNRDVAPIVERRCMPCHADPPQGGSVSLTTHAATLAEAPGSDLPVHEAMARRVRSDEAPMPPAPSPRLSEEEQATIEAWAAAGAPESCPGDGPSPPVFEAGACAAPADWGAPSFEFRMPGYALRDAENDWQCYGITVPPSDKRHLVALAPLFDAVTAANVHHMLVFRDSSGAAPEGVFPCDTASTSQWGIVGGWAPGMCSYAFPPQAGMPIRGGDRLILQMHYYNPEGAQKTDSSGMGFWYAPELREHDAGMKVVGDVTVAIPPGQPEHVEQAQCLWLAESDVHVFAAQPHMHTLGRAMFTEVFRKGEKVADVLRADPWSFDHQELRLLDPHVTIKPGDVVRTRCVYDSTSRSGLTTFGDRTEDEMCFGFLLHYPATNSAPCVQ